MSATTIDVERLSGLSGEGLKAALIEIQARQQEGDALLDAARSIPMAETFGDSARAIFDACCGVIGASAGYVALLSANGEENEVLFLEAGGRECTVDPTLPMPIRGLRGVAYAEHRAVYDNDFSHSHWMEFMPAGHVTLDNVLFSPIVVGDEAVGLIGIANKPGGFSDHDAEVAATFGELAAVALRYARYQDQLRRWAHVFENARWGVAVINPENRALEMLNPAFAEMHGYAVEELASKSITLVVSTAEQHSWQAQRERAEASGHCTFETEHIRRDGSRFPAQVDLTVVHEKVEEGMEDTGHGDEDAPLEHYYVVNVQDISERRAKDEALRRSNVELGRYAEVAAHQLREPLRSIASYTQLLAKRYGGQLDAEAGEFIDYAVAGAERLQRLLRDLLLYSEVGGGEVEHDEVHTNALVKEVLETLAPRINDSYARIELSDLPNLRGSRGELRQLFEHLLVNALDGTLGGAGGEPPRVHLSAERDDDGLWRITVADNGAGIAPRHHERIFKLFERLQGPLEGEGTGIGLALCRKVVEHHGGRIWVESEEGEGARFLFTLPGA